MCSLLWMLYCWSMYVVLIPCALMLETDFRWNSLLASPSRGNGSRPRRDLRGGAAPSSGIGTYPPGYVDDHPSMGDIYCYVSTIYTSCRRKATHLLVVHLPIMTYLRLGRTARTCAFVVCDFVVLISRVGWAYYAPSIPESIYICSSDWLTSLCTYSIICLMEGFLAYSKLRMRLIRMCELIRVKRNEYDVQG